MKLKQVQDLRVRTKIKRERDFNSAVKRQMAAYALINPTDESGGIEIEDV